MHSQLRSSLRIHAIRHAAEGVLLFDLRQPAGEELPGFQAGAHVDVHLPGGLARSYSLSNDPAERHRYVIGVKREPSSRGGSAWLHDAARAGTFLEVGSPRNNFALREDAPHSVLIAGGIGITPIWSMLQRLERLQRPWSLHYRSRSRSTAPFLAELAEASGNGRVDLSFSDEGAARMDLPDIVRKAPAGAHFYCCGPAAMMAAFRAACAEVASGRVHLEHFSATQDAGESRGFVVTLVRSGREITVPPELSVLEALERCGIDAPSSCREGLCGACETRVLAGTPEHRDLVLSDAEKAAGQTMMICCSRAVSPRLELDL